MSLADKFKLSEWLFLLVLVRVWVNLVISVSLEVTAKSCYLASAKGDCELIVYRCLAQPYSF